MVLCYIYYVLKKILILILVCNYSFSQIGGGSAFEFLNLQTSPRISALGGYGSNVFDSDLNLGLFNPALINSKMNSYLTINYINYHADINYGSVLFSHDFKKNKTPILFSLTYLDYGVFDETNEFGELIGEFSANEYLFSVGFSKKIYAIDSLRFFNFGFNIKSAVSQLYLESSFALLSDISFLYSNDKKRIISSLVIRNLGYQLVPYYSKNREKLPLEIFLSVSNRLQYMPLRWTFALQHIETLDLTFDNTSQSSNYLNANNQNGLGQKILRHFVFSGEFLITKNLNLRFGYNNRKRAEMIILDRKAMVGFSCGFSFKINRFKFDYSREFHHFSNPVNSIGITTNISNF